MMRLSPNLLYSAAFFGITIALTFDRVTHVPWWAAAAPCLLLSVIFLEAHIDRQD